MNFVNKCCNDFRVCIFVDSVTQIKDMPAVADLAEIFDNFTSLFSHHISTGEQY